MTDIIERAKAALEGVTEGPWKWSRNCQRLEGGKDGYGEVIAPGPVDCMSHCYGGTSTIEFENEPHDAEFIAAARTLVPELIAEIERVRARIPVPEDILARVRALADKWDNAIEATTGNPSIVAKAFAAELYQALGDDR